MNAPLSAAQSLAQDNFKRLAANRYPGRGIVIGQSSSGFWVQLYWIMGRSPASRARVLVQEGSQVRSQATQAMPGQDQSLLVYAAMDAVRNRHVVSNGDHTDQVIQLMKNGRDFRNAIWGMEYEPDPPNLTPRIVGVLEVRGDGAGAWLGVVKPNILDGSTLRCSYDYEELSPGLGWCITTYAGDGAPPPAFAGEPLLLPLEGDEQALASAYWEALHAENRVALAVKRVEAGNTASHLTIVNRRE